MPFPTTSVLTNFTGANESPLSEGGNFVGTIRDVSLPSRGPCQRLSNQARRDTGITIAGEAVWFDDLAEDQEVFMTMAIEGDTDAQFAVSCRLTNNGTSTPTHYQCAYREDTTGIQIRRVVAGSAVQLGSTLAVDLAAGDKLGLACIGDQIQGWYTASGVWTSHANITATDTNITGSGKIAMYLGFGYDSDDFGGGEVVSSEADPTWTSLPRRGLARVS